MPAVPAATLPSVAPDSTSGLPYQTAAGATPDAFGAGIGQAMQGFAAQVGATGNMLEKHATKMQDDLNVAHTEDLFLQATTDSAQLLEKYKSLEGANRVNALPQLMDDMKEVREKYRGTAPNDDVAKKFDQLFSRQLGYSLREAGSLSAQATRQYMAEKSAAVQANSLHEIAKNSEDDKQFLGQTQTGLESMRQTPKYTGASPEEQELADREYVSAAWETRLQSLMIDKPQRARDLFEKNKDSMGTVAKLKLEPAINQAIINKTVPLASDRIIQDLGTGAMEERVKKLEGYSETPYKDFKQTSSGYGTKAQPGDENIPPEQRQAVFAQRLRNELASAYQIVDNFAPGLPKGARDALADLTYNAGSAWTANGLGQAVRAGNMETAKEKLLEYNKAGGEFNPGLADRRRQELAWWNSDQGPANSDPATMLSKSLDRAKEEGVKVFPNNPELAAKYTDTLQARLSADLGLMQRSARDMQTTAMNQIQREIFADPTNPISSLDKLSPQSQQLYSGLQYGGQKVVDTALRQAASMDVPPSNAGAKRFSELDGMSTKRPDEFIATNIDNEKLLTRGEKKILLAKQVNREELVKRGVAVDGAMKTMHPFLTDAGIADSAVDAGKRKEYERYRGMFEAAINTKMDETKRKLYPKEIEEIGQSLLKEVVTDPGWAYVPFTGETKKAYQLEVRKGSEAKDFAAIPSGSPFLHPDGSIRIKP